jgi:hypothetical protein
MYQTRIQAFDNTAVLISLDGLAFTFPIKDSLLEQLQLEDHPYLRSHLVELWTIYVILPNATFTSLYMHYPRV